MKFFNHLFSNQAQFTSMYTNYFFTALLAFSLLFLSSHTASAATHTVCASGCDYTTIQAAVDAAQSNDIIEIMDAVHTESNIIISNKSLTIKGQGQNETIVQAADAPENAVDGIFVVGTGNNNSYTFMDLTLQNGHANAGAGFSTHDDGGAVRPKPC